MKLKLVLLFLFFSHLTYSQTVYQSTTAPTLRFTDWINAKNEKNILEGKPIVLEFWASWCGPCVKAFPHFNKLTEKYSDKISFIAVNAHESKEIIENFLIKQKLSSYAALDEDKYLYNALDIQTIPVTIIIDKNGMLRWRGIATDLTEEILDLFLKENIFNIPNNKGVIHDQIHSISNPLPVNYRLKVEYGDQTMGKTLTQNLEEQFYLKLTNSSIYSMLSTSSDLLQREENWEYEKKGLYKDEAINFEIITDKSEDAEIVLDDAIRQLGKIFKFEIKSTKVNQEVLLLEYDSTRLNNFRSVDQTSRFNEGKITDKYHELKNASFSVLAFFISDLTGLKVRFDEQHLTRYDLILPQISDIVELNKILNQKYGIDLVKKVVKIDVNQIKR